MAETPPLIEVPYAPGPIEALDAFAGVLADAEAGATRDAFYGRLCYVICTLAAMDRAVIFRYDEGLRRVAAAGTHNLDIDVFSDANVSVESAPIARQALENDAVVEIPSPSAEEVPEGYRHLLQQGGLLVCVPLAAAGRWIGVALCDRASGEPLSQREQHLLWTLGKTAALIAAARIATFEGERARELQQRIDIAREVHDGVVQRLFGVSMALDSDGDFPPEERRRAAAEIQRALSDLKNVVQQPLGRVSRPTTTTLAQEVERLAKGHTDLRVEVAPGSRLDDVPESQQALAQSVFSEALRNAHKHAEPTRVVVSADTRNGAFILEVTNDGVTGAAKQTTGMGLRLAAFEALNVGGFVEFGPRENNLWLVRLVVPVDDDED